jgi:hypothetical protein
VIKSFPLASIEEREYAVASPWADEIIDPLRFFSITPLKGSNPLSI